MGINNYEFDSISYKTLIYCQDAGESGGSYGLLIPKYDHDGERVDVIRLDGIYLPDSYQKIARAMNIAFVDATQLKERTDDVKPKGVCRDTKSS